MLRRVAIVAAKRTPLGAFQGSLSALPAPRLAAKVIQACLAGLPIPPSAVQELRMGNVLQAGVGQAPARQAAIYADLPKSVTAVTVNKVCGSGMAALMDQASSIRLGLHDITIAGGMESMSNAPYLLPGARAGYRMNHKAVQDGLVMDGLWDPYHDMHMGHCAEVCAEEYGFTRELQDAFALESLRRAKAATVDNVFKQEIVLIEQVKRGKTTIVSVDEQPGLLKPEKVPSLPPAFKQGGTITAANASSISDGAAVLVLMEEQRAKDMGVRPLGYITGYAAHAHEPMWFTTAPAFAVRKVLDQLNLQVSDIDLWEINEAFAVVAMAAMKDLGLSHENVNVAGGACVLGHPIGCTGARLVVTLLHHLHRLNKRRGLATLCIGGGEATAMVVERAD